jgi:hypothetical protein
MTTILPTNRPMMYCVTGAGEPITGTTHVGELTGVNPALTVVADADENAFVAALPADAFPELPDSGWLEADTIYRYQGGAVIVRQSHERTHYPPQDTPALFIVYREDAADVLEWVAGESVLVGTRRTYEGVTYECIQAHVTQADWTPPSVPALWALVPDEPPGDEWIDSGARVTALYGAGVIGVTTTAPFSAGLAIRINGTEASVTRIHQAGAPGILVISPHINVSGGEIVEIRG